MSLRSLTLCLLFLTIGATANTGCDLFEEIPPPGAIEPDPMKKDMTYTPTCANASCTAIGEYRCRESFYEQCQEDVALTCSVFKPLINCGDTTSLESTAKLDTASMHEQGSHISILTDKAVVARGSTILTFTAASLDSPASKTLDMQGPFADVLATETTILAADTMGTVYQLDGALSVTQTYAADNSNGPALLKEGGKDIYIAQSGTVRALNQNWAQAVDAAGAPTALVAGDEDGVEKVYAAFGNKLYKLDHVTGKIEAEATAPSTIIDMVAENGGVWVVYQKTMARYEGKNANFEQPTTVEQDSLCGTAASISQHGGALWVTDIGGCLSKYSLQLASFDNITVDLNNRPGGPATTNYRPHAPTFKDGLGYVVAKTTELVVFDEQTLNESKRIALTSPAVPFASPAIWEGQLIISHDGGLDLFAEYCPCP